VAGRPGGEPVAFLSYAHADDEHDGGLITEFRRRLEGELRAQTGRREMHVFQDRDDIAWGQAWKERVDGSLDAATFIIPIVSPAFLASDECRRELARFLDRERRLGRGDLVLPVYWITVPALERAAGTVGDELAVALAARQYADWRKLRFQPLTAPACREAVAALAGRVRDVLDPDVPPAGPAVQTQATAPGTGPGPDVPPEVQRQAAAPGTSPGPDVPPEVQRQAAVPGTSPDPVGPAKATNPGGGAPAGPAAPGRRAALVVDPLHLGDFTTVAAAVAAARAGDRILVRPGLYEGAVVLDKPVALAGEGPVDEITLVAAEGSVLVFTASYGSVQGLTLRATGQPREAGDPPVIDIRTGRLVLDGCDISGSATGVAVHANADPRVRRCRIHHTSGFGVRVVDGGAGVFEDNDITGNTFSNIKVLTGGKPTVRNNRITGSQQSGVYVHDKGAGVFEDNDITGNTLSNVEVRTGGNPTVRGNRITGSQQSGVYVYDNGAGVFEDNEITGNTLDNVAVRTGGNPTVRNNRITGSRQCGVSVNDKGAGVFENNEITGNRRGDWVLWGADRKRLVRK
jgi:F-box protein 11